MNIQFFTREILTHKQWNALSQLTNACRQAEPITLTVPEDGDGFLIAYGNPSVSHGPVLGCLIYCTVQEDLWECYAFTHPDSRRQGIFSSLLEQLEQKAMEQEQKSQTSVSLAFLFDGKSPNALAAAKSLEMELWYSEYQMELTLPKKEDLPKSSSLFLVRNIIRKDSLDTEAPEERWIYYAYPKTSSSSEPCQENCPADNKTSRDNSAAVGSCCLIPCQNTSFYLYNVEIRKELRGKGLGKQLLSALFSQLPKGARIRLQVSSQNKPALSLYKKAGFGITETLSYYI